MANVDPPSVVLEIDLPILLDPCAVAPKFPAYSMFAISFAAGNGFIVGLQTVGIFNVLLK